MCVINNITRKQTYCASQRSHQKRGCFVLKLLDLWPSLSSNEILLLCNPNPHKLTLTYDPNLQCTCCSTGLMYASKNQAQRSISSKMQWKWKDGQTDKQMNGAN